MMERRLGWEARRLWSAAEELDRLRGDATATDWTAERVHALRAEGRDDDIAAVRCLREELEGELARTRRRREVRT